MVSYAESAGGARIWRDKRRNAGAAVFVTAMILGAGVTPFHYYDMLVTFSVTVGPALLVLVSIGKLCDRISPTYRSASSHYWMAGILLFGTVSLDNLLLWANERFDTSPATREVAPVVEKWSRTGKGTTTYLAGVSTLVPSSLGEHSFYGSQPVQVSKAQWERIVPGTSRLVLREHRGALRTMWFEPDVDVSN